MDQDHRRAGSGRLVAAALTAAAQRHTNWHQLTEDETAAAVAELQKILAGRDDGPELLAETAGILLGFSEGSLAEAKAKAAAQLCRLAGADEALIPRRAEEGCRRAASAPCHRSQADCADSVLLPRRAAHNRACAARGLVGVTVVSPTRSTSPGQ